MHVRYLFTNILKVLHYPPFFFFLILTINESNTREEIINKMMKAIDESPTANAILVLLANVVVSFVSGGKPIIVCEKTGAQNPVDTLQRLFCN